MNKIKENKYIICLLFVVVFLSLITIVSNFKIEKFVFADSNEINIENYINSDSLLGDNFKTIYDYYSGDSPLYATKSKIIKNPNNEADLIVSGAIDDDIVQIVPKQLFVTAGDNMYIGNEYGFLFTPKIWKLIMLQQLWCLILN